MKVRYSYLKQQFGNAPKLWRDLKKFVNTGDFTLVSLYLNSRENLQN